MLVLNSETASYNEKTNNADFNSYENSLIEYYKSKVISCDDINILRLSFSENSTQEDLEKITESFNYEILDSKKILALSYAFTLHQDLKFPDKIKSNASRILSRFRLHNLKVISHFTKVAKACNNHKIPVMLLKGGALKFLRPELSRSMGDTDILVPYECFSGVKRIVKSLGYDYEFFGHSMDLHENGSAEGTVDIHRYIDIETGHEKCLNEILFKRARKEKVFAAEAYIPSNEDMLFLALVNLTKNLKNDTSLSNIIFNFFDCRFLIESKPDFDWKIVYNNAKETKSLAQMGFASKFMNKFVPGIIPYEILKTKELEEEITGYCKVQLYDKVYLESKQVICHPVKILESLKSFEGIIKYLNLKPKYITLKNLKKFPYIVKKYYDKLIKIEF